MFSSLKKNRPAGSPEVVDPLAELSNVLLHSIQTNALRLEGPAAVELRTRIQDIESRIDGGAVSASDGQLYAGWTRKAFENYSAAVDADPMAQRADWAPMLGQFSDAIRTLCSPSDLANHHLRCFEDGFQKAHTSGNFEALRMQLEESLKEILQQAAEQHREILGLMTRARLEIPAYFQLSSLCSLAVAEDADLPFSLDAVTALPDRYSAELAISTSRDRGYTHAVLLPVDRLDLLRTRFGPEAADSTLICFASAIKAHLQPHDQLFRWSQNALLLIFRRELTHDAIRSEMVSIAGHKLEHTVQQNDRHSLVTITSTWSIFALSASTSPETLIKKIDSTADTPNQIR